MNYKKGAVTLCVAALLIFGYNGATAHAEPSTSAQSAVVMEQSSRRVLFQKNAHQPLPMASTTKIMTALVALKHGHLDDRVKVGPHAAGVEGSSIYLKAGETWTLEQLLFGLMLQSGNDAAVAIAEHVGGSLEGFLALMNDEAAKLGAVDTHFATVNGLDKAGHRTSAYDLALITATAMDDADFRRIVGSKSAVIGDGDVRRAIPNKNKLLWRMDGANGVKTGYTKGAGRCFVGAAQRGGMQLIAVVLNCGPMFEDSQALMEDAFARYSMVTVALPGLVLGEAPTEQGQRGTVRYGFGQSLTLPLDTEERRRVAVRVDPPTAVKAPIAEGQPIGQARVYLDGENLQTVELVALQEEKQRTWRWYADRLVEGMLWRRKDSP